MRSLKYKHTSTVGSETVLCVLADDDFDDDDDRNRHEMQKELLLMPVA